MANRKKQIQAVQDKINDAVEPLDMLISELEVAYDNLPESLQDGAKGEAMQARIDKLTEWRDALTEMVEDDEV